MSANHKCAVKNMIRYYHITRTAETVLKDPNKKRKYEMEFLKSKWKKEYPPGKGKKVFPKLKNKTWI